MPTKKDPDNVTGKVDNLLGSHEGYRESAFYR